MDDHTEMQIGGAVNQLPGVDLLGIQILESQWEIVSFEAFLKGRDRVPASNRHLSVSIPWDRNMECTRLNQKSPSLKSKDLRLQGRKYGDNTDQLKVGGRDNWKGFIGQKGQFKSYSEFNRKPMQG